MKGIICIIIIIGIASCAVQRKNPMLKEVEQQTAQKDSTEYELISFDSEFDTWYSLKSSPVLDRSNDYYISWNARYIQAWNFKSIQSRTATLFSQPLNIETNKDYGFQINKQLYYYFRFVETELKIQILDFKRHSFP